MCICRYKKCSFLIEFVIGFDRCYSIWDFDSVNCCGFFFLIFLLFCVIFLFNNNINFYEVFRFWLIIIDYIFEFFDIEIFDLCY